MKILHTNVALVLNVVALGAVLLNPVILLCAAQEVSQLAPIKKKTPKVTKKETEAGEAKGGESVQATKKTELTSKNVPSKDNIIAENVSTPGTLSKNNEQADTDKKGAHETKTALPKGDLVDRIEVVIYGDEGVQIITQSDLARLSIDGQERTKDDIILENLMFLDAQKMHMVQGDDAVDAYLNNIQREHNMSKEQLEYLFANSGYSFEEAREQLRKLYAVNSIIDFKIRSRLIVPEQDVVAYFKSHPVKLQPTYQVQRAVLVLPADAAEAELLKKEVELWCQTGAGSLKPSWDEPFWIEKGDLALDKQFITTMLPGSCAVSGETTEGLELFKLVDKKEEREQSIEERYREIVDILRRPKYEEMLADYKKQLYDSASIVYL